MKEFTVQQPDTLKKFTDNTYPQGSFYFRTLLKKKDIRVNGEKASADVPVRTGDRITYYTTPEQEKKEAFAILYEDDNVLVTDKESGVNSEAVFSSLCEKRTVYFIHRLDRNTQGLMVFAKTKEAEDCLLRAFKDRKVKKIYHALCGGRFSSDSGILQAYLKKDSKSSTVRIFSSPQGEKIVTEYRVLRREGELNEVEIILHTGKTHQIRAHMAFNGTPVLGDEKYGDRSLNARYRKTRQCLIAKKTVLFAGGVLSYLDGKEFLSRFEIF